jgi:hypothetical protein
MDIDEMIVQLGTKLDEWLDGNLTGFASNDRPAQIKALLAGIDIVKELDQLKANGLTALKKLLNDRESGSQEERTGALVRGFEFAARLQHALHDELLDTDGETEAARLKHAVVDALDEMDSSRAKLAGLLDHSDAGVRASAGAYLINLMSERVVPILREIEEKEEGLSADFTAHWALLDWELKQKAAAKGSAASAKPSTE